MIKEQPTQALKDQAVKPKKFFNFSALQNTKLRSYAMLFALIAIAIIFQILTDGTFLKPRNFSILIRQMSITGIITIGMVLLIISGNFDLSVGSLVALSGGVAAVMQVWFDASTPVAILMGVIVGLIFGAWQGFWVAYRKLPSFIVTLGGMMMFRGIYLVMTDGITITPLNPSFTNLAQGFIPPNFGLAISIAACLAFTVLSVRARISKRKLKIQVDSLPLLIAKIFFGNAIIIAMVIWMNRYLGIPLPVIVLLILALIFNFISTRTQFGRNLYSIGGNEEAARFSGVKVEKTIMSMFVLMGGLSAISGVFLTARLDGATASAGTSFEMDAIAACVIGGTSLSGGQGSIFLAMIGALIMASLDNGMSLMNTSFYFQHIVKGLVLIFAVWFDVSTNKKK